MASSMEYEWRQQNCPICEVSPIRFIGHRGGQSHREGLGVECEIWRCSKCGLVFPNPMPIPKRGVDQHYERSADDYFQHHDFDSKSENAIGLLNYAETLIGGKGTLLDIGAGRGELVSSATREGWRAVGIEPSTAHADHAARSGADIRREPLEECGFESSSFDVVILAAVLEHLYNPAETISEISRILRPGGALFLDVPNEQGLYFKVGNFYQKLKGRRWVVNLAPTFEPFHVFGFGPKSLRRLLAKYDFNIAAWRVYGGTSFVPGDNGLMSQLERQAAKVVTSISNVGNLGTYIETWAIKK
jgi:2-polyprenyl-3-methyl-5-hydroxy-6-metoxy-1,4-benzoquinol methylase